MDLTKSFEVVVPGPYLAYLVLQGDLCILYCVHRTELIIKRIMFITLCCA